LKGSTFESQRDKYARMGTLVENNIMMAKMAQGKAEADSQNAEREARTNLLKQQVADAQNRAKEEAAQKQMLTSLNEFNQQSALPAKMRVTPELNQFLYSNSATPTEIPSYLYDTANSNIESANRGSGVLSPAVQQDFKSKLNDPVVQQILQVFNATGKVPDANTVERITVNSALAAQRLEDKKLAAKVRNPGMPVDMINERGERVTRVYDNVTNLVLSEVPSKDDPKNIVNIAARTEEATARGKANRAFLDGVEQQGNSAKEAIDTHATIRGLLNKGATTGALRAAIPDIAANGAEALGLLDTTGQANQQQLQSLLAKSALENAKTYYKGQGSVSDQERKAVEKISLSYGKGTLTNLQMMDQLDQVHQRASAKDDYLYDFKKENPSIDDIGIVAAIKDWDRDPNNALKNFKPASSTVNADAISVENQSIDSLRDRQAKLNAKAQNDKR